MLGPNQSFLQWLTNEVMHKKNEHTLLHTVYVLACVRYYKERYVGSIG